MLIGVRGYFTFQREIERELTIFPALTADAYLPFVFLYDAIADTKSQPHPLPHVLGCKKWIENLVHVGAVDAFAIVAHHQQASAVLDPPFDADDRRAVPVIFSFHRVDGILNKVYHH